MPGFFRSTPGGRFPQACLPCAAGYYASVAGASTCLKCPVGTVCRVGSSMPSIGSNGIGSASLPLVVQPLKYSAAAGTAALNQALAVTGIAGGVLIILVLIFFGLSMIPAHKFALWCPFCCKQASDLRHTVVWKRWDFLFPAEHPAESRPRLYTSDDKRWIELFILEWQTTLGGLWSVLGVIIFAVVALFLLLPYRYTNTLETRGLIPQLDVDQVVLTQIASSFNISVQFNGYADICTASAVIGQPGPCHPFISVSNSVRVNALGREILTCQASAAPPSCVVNFTCSDCTVAGSTESIQFLLLQQFAYATSIVWSASTDAGVIPPAQSIVSATMDPSFFGTSSSYVFRGSNPTVINLGVVRGLFSSQDGQQAMGYQLGFTDAVAGSMSLSTDFLTNAGIGVSFNYTLDSPVFSVVQVPKLTVASALSQIGGAVSAIIGIMAALLKIAEVKTFAAERQKDPLPSAAAPDLNAAIAAARKIQGAYRSRAHNQVSFICACFFCVSFIYL